MGKDKDKKSVVPRKEQVSTKAEARANPAPTRDTLHSNKQPKIIQNDHPASDDDDDGRRASESEAGGVPLVGNASEPFFSLTHTRRTVVG